MSHNKRSPGSQLSPTPKRPRTSSRSPTPNPASPARPVPRTHTLDGFVSSSRPDPGPVYVTREIEDRGSLFKGLAFKATCTSDVSRIMEFLKHRFHPQPASHNITAWRFLALKKAHDGLGGPDDFEVQCGSEDDGEKWAGAKVLKVMESQRTVDAVVVVSRWYGGTLLGPVRFNHIESCASDACKVFKSLDALHDDLERLASLDDQVEELRAELKSLTKPDAPPDSNPQPPSQTASKKYQHLEDSVDLQASARLIAAREQSIALLRRLILKAKPTESSIRTTPTELPKHS